MRIATSSRHCSSVSARPRPCSCWLSWPLWRGPTCMRSTPPRRGREPPARAPGAARAGGLCEPRRLAAPDVDHTVRGTPAGRASLAFTSHARQLRGGLYAEPVAARTGEQHRDRIDDDPFGHRARNSRRLRVGPSGGSRTASVGARNLDDHGVARDRDGGAALPDDAGARPSRHVGAVLIAPPSIALPLVLLLVAGFLRAVPRQLGDAG